jgi:tight adherence protein B
MLFPLFTFVLVLAVIGGAYWLFVLRPERTERAALQQRLASARPVKKQRLVVADSGERPHSRVLIALQRLCGPIQRQLNRAGLRLGLASFLALSAGVAGFAAVAVLAAGGPGLLALAAAGVGAVLPFWYVQAAASRRTWKFEEQFPEAVDLISRALRAGHALPTALGMVAGEVPDPVGSEFKKLYCTTSRTSACRCPTRCGRSPSACRSSTRGSSSRPS